MDTLAISFFSLVKNNNGFFKSEKQAKFLSSKVHPLTNQFIVEHGNNMLTLFNCDEEGVLSVEKVTTVKGQRVFTLVFDRNDASVAQSIEQAKQAKTDKAQQKRINDARKAIGDRLACREEYAAKGDQRLYNTAMLGYAEIAGVSKEDLKLFKGKDLLPSLYKKQLHTIDNLFRQIMTNPETKGPQMLAQLDKLGAIKTKIEGKLKALN